jgi:glycosyltransferase involved in cell wall biosynthesis
MTLLSLNHSRQVSNQAPLEDRFPSQATARPLKVLYVISDLSIGGAEMALYKLLEVTDRERFEPIVISLIDQGSLREPIEALGIAVYSTRMKAGRPSPLGLWRLIKLIRRIKPDLILGWMYHSCLAAQLAKTFSAPRVPVVWSIHYSISSLATEKSLTAAVIRICGLLSRLPAKIVHVSRAGQTQHEPLGYHNENSCVIPNGIDVQEFVPSPEARRSVRAELGIPQDSLLIGVIGRYHPVKDHANFLKAAGLISEAHPETHFVLIGRGVDNANEALSKLIHQLGLAERTHLLGERRDTSRLAAALDIFSLSSSYGESCPNVIGEAMACGVPCVVTDIGDAVWILGETGQVIPPRDAHALAAAWKDMIELGSENRRALGLLARSRVADHFPIQAVMARYEDLYEAVLGHEASEQFMSLTSPRVDALGDA